MRALNRPVYFVFGLLLMGCQPPESGTLRMGEFEIGDGEVIRYVIHDHAIRGRPTKLPATVILLRYHRGGADAPRFDWECKTTVEGDDEFRVGGHVVNETKGTQFFFNAIDGSLQVLELPWHLLEDEFQRDAKLSREDLCNFWDRYVRSHAQRQRDQ